MANETWGTISPLANVLPSAETSKLVLPPTEVLGRLGEKPMRRFFKAHGLKQSVTVAKDPEQSMSVKGNKKTKNKSVVELRAEMEEHRPTCNCERKLSPAERFGDLESAVPCNLASKISSREVVLPVVNRLRQIKAINADLKIPANAAHLADFIYQQLKRCEELDSEEENLNSFDSRDGEEGENAAGPIEIDLNLVLSAALDWIKNAATSMTAGEHLRLFAIITATQDLWEIWTGGFNSRHQLDGGTDMFAPEWLDLFNDSSTMIDLESLLGTEYQASAANDPNHVPICGRSEEDLKNAFAATMKLLLPMMNNYDKHGSRTGVNEEPNMSDFTQGNSTCLLVWRILKTRNCEDAARKSKRGQATDGGVSAAGHTTETPTHATPTKPTANAKAKIHAAEILGEQNVISMAIMNADNLTSQNLGLHWKETAEGNKRLCLGPLDPKRKEIADCKTEIVQCMEEIKLYGGLRSSCVAQDNELRATFMEPLQAAMDLMKDRKERIKEIEELIMQEEGEQELQGIDKPLH